MRYCFRCGTKVEENTQFCPHCGANIKEELNRYNYVPNKEEKNQEKISPSHEDQYQYSLNYSYKGADELIEGYVGNKYEKIKNSHFSIPTLLFGPIYFLYRKLYLYGFIWFLVEAILLPISVIMAIIIRFLLAIGFSTIYLTEVKKRVENLRVLNQNINRDLLINRCKIKGGTNKTILAIMLLIIIMFGILVAIGTYEAYLNHKDSKTKTLENNQNYQINDLNYTIPKGFEPSSYKTETYQSYHYYEDYKYCSISFKSTDYLSMYDNIEDYINSNIYLSGKDQVSQLLTMPINNQIWSYKIIQDEYSQDTTYALQYKDHIYEIKTTDTLDSNDIDSCKLEYQKILQSINYKE